jgi:hypothetical protein
MSARLDDATIVSDLLPAAPDSRDLAEAHRDVGLAAVLPEQVGEQQDQPVEAGVEPVRHQGVAAVGRGRQQIGHDGGVVQPGAGQDRRGHLLGPEDPGPRRLQLRDRG